MMEFIYNSNVLAHDTGQHPENKDKLSAFVHLPETEVLDAHDWLSLVHTPEYIARVRNACLCSESLDADTLTSPTSWKAALTAVGAAVLAAERRDFALIRPPGHHAYAARGSGFCLFNNIAIATQRLVNEGKRVLIIDIDGHFGDGTSDIFYDTDQVFFWSIHQSPAFPYKGAAHDIGVGKGKGYNLNVPLPPGAADDLFLDVFEQFLPIAQAFQPDVVGVSAGFDGHIEDPLLSMRLTTHTFFTVGKRLSETFEHLFAVLEGGYHPMALTRCIYSFIDGVNGTANSFPETPTTSTPSQREIYEATNKQLQLLFNNVNKVVS